ncbi:RsiG family protein [Streptomyces sp. NPDC003860]
MSTSGTRRTTVNPARPPHQRTGQAPSRAVDHLAEHFADLPQYELPALRLPELRALRRQSQQDEADLSYVRRLLQGRIDILRAELVRRAHPEPEPDPDPAPDRSAAGEGSAARATAADGPVDATGGTGEQEAAAFVERLSGILADAPSSHRTSARHVTVSTPHSEEYRLLAAKMLADVELSDPAARTDDELHAAMGRLVRYEQQVSRRRHVLQRTADDCSAEIARRYREGEAQVDDLLT